MHPALTRCPVCRTELNVTRLQCPSCDTVVEGRFTAGHFANLTTEQILIANIEAVTWANGILETL